MFMKKIYIVLIIFIFSSCGEISPKKDLAEKLTYLICKDAYNKKECYRKERNDEEGIFKKLEKCKDYNKNAGLYYLESFSKFKKLKCDEDLVVSDKIKLRCTKFEQEMSHFKKNMCSNYEDIF